MSVIESNEKIWKLYDSVSRYHIMQNIRRGDSFDELSPAEKDLKTEEILNSITHLFNILRQKQTTITEIDSLTD